MEILVVLFLVSSAMLGVVSLIVQNIQVQSVNKNNLIASSLAQEGIELIRQTRDLDWQGHQPFGTFLADGSYWVDYRSIVPTSATTTDPLYIKDGFYVHKNDWETGLTPTVFSRQIVITRYPAYPGSPLGVRSIISWVDRNRPYRYELQDLLFDWR